MEQTPELRTLEFRRCMANLKLKINDPVRFYSQRGLEKGFIASVYGTKATVVAEDGTEFDVPILILKLLEGVKPKRVYTHNQMQRAKFSIGDPVLFYSSNGKFNNGTITRMNPKRARLECAGEIWDVPYEMLEKETPDLLGIENMQRLDTVAQQADELLQKHQLSDWRFTYDDATKRGGVCLYKDKMISISQQFCLRADEAEITDTLLHEIAHALVGPNHGHDAVWKAKALEIGCSGNRTHNIHFTPPKFIVSCSLCDWHIGREKRSRELVCKHCGQNVTFEHYTKDLWNSYRQ